MTGRVDPSTWPLYPPESWFDVPDELPDDVYCHVVMDGPEAGRVYGRVHHAGTNLLGAPGGPWTPPPSPSGLHDVQLGVTETAEGSTIRTANIGGRVNHAPLPAGYREAIKHYENTAAQTMRVRYHQVQTPSGPAIAYSGAMWPDVTEIDVARVRASALSGDWRWRPEYAGYDFCGSQLVNNPGLPLRMVASLDEHPPIVVCEDGTCPVPYAAAPTEPVPVEARLDDIEDAVLEFADLLGYQVEPGPQTAAVCAPYDRVDEIECSLDELVRFAAAEWDEEKHPRAPSGGSEGGQFTSGEDGGGASADATVTTTLASGTAMFHTTRRADADPLAHPSEMGESGPGTYVSTDRAYADKIAAYDDSMHVVEMRTTEPLAILDRTKPGGEERYRAIASPPGQPSIYKDPAAAGARLKAAGFDGVRNISPGEEYPETTILSPEKVEYVSKPAAARPVTFDFRTPAEQREKDEKEPGKPEWEKTEAEAEAAADEWWEKDEHGRFTGSRPHTAASDVDYIQGEDGKFQGSRAHKGDPEQPDPVVQLRELAAKEDPVVTPQLQDVGRDVGLDMVGLDFRLKGEGSLERKIGDKIAEGMTRDQAAASVKDALRYTYTTDAEDYTQATTAAMRELQERGYDLVEQKNYWQRGDPYSGLNTVFRTPEGLMFELQFHTPDSFDVKEVGTHKQYEEYRKADTPLERRQELYDEMAAQWENVEVPSNIMGVGDPRFEPRPA